MRLLNVAGASNNLKRRVKNLRKHNIVEKAIISWDIGVKGICQYPFFISSVKQISSYIQLLEQFFKPRHCISNFTFTSSPSSAFSLIVVANSTFSFICFQEVKMVNFPVPPPPPLAVWPQRTLATYKYCINTGTICLLSQSWINTDDPSEK